MRRRRGMTGIRLGRSFPIILTYFILSWYIISCMDKANEQWQGEPYKVRVAAGGRIVIPAGVRHELGIKEGEEVLLSRRDDGYRITTSRDAIRRAQDLFARVKEPGEGVVDEFLRERR